MKLNHAKLGELELVYNNGLYIKIEGKEIGCYVQCMDKGQVLGFRGKQTIAGVKDVPGIKLEEGQSQAIKEFESSEKINQEINEFKTKKTFTWYTTSNIATPIYAEYNYNTIKLAEERILKNYKHTIEAKKTIAGSIGKYTVEITGEEVLNILEEIKAESEAKSEAKLEESKQRIEALKEQATRKNVKIEIERYTEDCNDENEACDIDVIVTYVLPNGKFETERYHTW